MSLDHAPRPSTRVTAPTETRNLRTTEIDILPTLDVLRLLNAEDALVPNAVARVLPALARAVDLTAAALGAGGRLHYFGAGTSGRLGVLDAAELPPTYNLAPGRVVAHHAGGPAALQRAVEDVEDACETGAHDALQVAPGDVVVGLTASGRTPYVAGALRQARESGASTVLVSANPEAPLAALADVHIGVDTGPEAIAGSTRMKAATAQKLVLHSLSTAVMVRLGHTYSNLMVSLVASNAKLRGRLVTILVEATGQDEDQCAAALTDAEGEVKVALVALLGAISATKARLALDSADGIVRAALAALAEGDGSAPRSTAVTVHQSERGHS